VAETITRQEVIGAIRVIYFAGRDAYIATNSVRGFSAAAERRERKELNDALILLGFEPLSVEEHRELFS